MSLNVKAQDTNAAQDEIDYLRRAARLAGIGSWEWKIATNEVTWSDELFAIWGIDKSEFGASYETFLATVHPEDRDFVNHQVQTILNTTEPLNYECRIVREDNSELRYIHSWGEVVDFDETGKPARVIGTVQDVTARKLLQFQQDELLDREREHIGQLERLDQLKDVFVATISHELRTPLTSIRGYLELVLDGEAGALTAEQRRYLETVDRNSERLLQLVQDLLAVAEIQDGDLSLDLEPIDLSQIVALCLEAARPHARGKGIDLSDLHSPVQPFPADRRRISQLLDNLLTNAIKFTDPGGLVSVSTASTERSAVIEITDTGIGISADDQARLFDRFFRSDEATTHAIPGTGLGLSISKAIVDAHGGRITVESVAGAGTTFRIELPLDGPAGTLSP